jgi:DeoR family fructose operon transcriptional repressor
MGNDFCDAGRIAMLDDSLRGSPLPGAKGKGLVEEDRSLFAVERRMKMAEFIGKQKTASVAEITRWLGASPATVRRDLLWLDKQGLILRTRGGALALDHGPQRLLRQTAPGYQDRLNECIDEKKAIGRLAAENIADGEIIMIDAGSTNQYMVSFFARKRDLTVITNSLEISRELLVLTEQNPSLTIICSGGTVFQRTRSLIGMTAEQALAQFFVDRAFIGVRGLSLQHGITSPFFEEISVKRQMMKAAREVVVLADHTKINQTFAGLIAPLSAVHTLITDAGADPDLLQAIRENGPHVLVAPLVEEQE